MSMRISSKGASPTEIRMFLRADSAEELVRLQLRNNIKFQAAFSYTDFSQSPVDKKWYCWFLTNAEDIQPQPLVAGNTKRGVANN